MKSNAFREQVAMLFSWFKTWSDCEQTVAIYSLLKRSSPVQAKFLQQVLQYVLTDCNDVKELEEKANDEEYVRSLRSKEKGVFHQLLQLFPLLKVGESAAKAAYLELIPDHLTHTIQNGVNIEESRQLISFSLIHPALSPEERLPLQGWLVYLDERLTYGNNFQNFNNAFMGSNNRLAVGSSSSSSSSGGSNNPSHSPSPVSPSHRSISQSSLCQDSSNQDYNNQVIPTNTNPNMLSPHILPKHNHSNTSQSSSPTINFWQQHSQQQVPNNQISHGLSSGVDCNLTSGQAFSNLPGNFSNTNNNNSGNNNLAVGHSSGSNISYSPSSISSGQRSISQTSLCQDSQEQVQINSSGMGPLSGHSSGSSVHQWQHQQQQQSNQQLFQHSFQGNQSVLEPSPGHSSLSSSDVSRYGGHYNAPSGNSHRTLRASNSHNMGAYDAPRGHMPLKATASAPPNFNSSQLPSSKYQDKFSYSSPSGQRSHARLSRTRSLVPPSRWSRDQQAPNPSISGSSSSLWWRQNPSKSGSGSTGHAPLSPQSSVTSSESSDSHQEDGPPSNDDFQEGPSRDLLLWLKEIRLHKYALLFRNMTYEELPNLTEEWLLQNNVVRGARQRFMINIEKLRERQSLLRQLEKTIKGDESINLVLYELKAVLQTPIGPFDAEQQQQKQQNNNSNTGATDLNDANTTPSISSSITTTTTPTTSSPTSSTTAVTGPDSKSLSTNSESTSSSSSSSSSTITTVMTTTSSTSTPAVPSSSSSTSPSSSSSQPDSPSDSSNDGVAEGDLPSQICRLLGKVCQELLRATGRDQHSFQMYLMLVRTVLHHDAFTAEQKKALESQVKTAEKLWRPTPHSYRPNTSWWRGKTYPVCDSYGSRIIPRSKRDPAPDSYQQQQLHWRQQQQQRQYQQQQQRQQGQHHHVYHPPHHSYHHHHQQQQQQQQHGGHQSWSSGSSSFRPGQGSIGGHQTLTRNSSLNPAYPNKPGLIEPPAKQPLSRTQSAPINRPMTLPTHTPIRGDDVDLNASLVSLCVQMTEQALSNSEQGDTSKGSGFSMR